ncbi:OB-fold-containig protein [Neorhizobium galegae]|uniref:Membrane protein implicated in regulation of membrane protease activity n=1 Tax=Neorhizobium galegae bv. officinalis TaxID=323656 RepID=A0A0T7GV98_NEOGA|nr:OB-fold-containig protein [Neorhizobium galegae]CDZ51211.1 Membrane protein implicated in regulation of membrane protease activity [Neorhizobium galegae bv. officinalis]
MQLFLAPESLPFAIAAAMLAILTGLEMICLLIGFSLGEVVDKAWPGDHGGLSGLMSWLNIGGVPVLILLMLFLGLFAINGFVLQSVAQFIWSPLPGLVAAVPAFGVALPEVRFFSRIVARIVPRDETYAVDLSDFIGRSGDVTVGPLDQGLPGRVRLKDRHGNWHALRARAARTEAPIPIGSKVLIVDHALDIFIAIRAPSDTLTPPNPSFTEHP